ncbi:5-oxoprolinase subunit B family protein [Tsukamurella soli]|uniref:5-oxoprolinase subunit PxpB n=1 Tax=Tsukamurella soli TaxID=644556 RepID=A0ABP8JH70_9ACTN
MNAATAPRATIAGTGESALRVIATTGDSETDWVLVHHLSRRLRDAGIDGLVTTVPTYESLLIELDPTVTSDEAMTAVVAALLPTIDLTAPLSRSPKHFRVPVRYGGEVGPDLEDVARTTGLSVEEVVATHSRQPYTVRCLGAPGGSPMLDCPAPLVGVPRLRSPRTSVRQGAVSLAGRQATVAPASAPGGWCVIGRTPLVLLDMTREPMVPYTPGDTLSFEPIDDDTFAALSGRPLTAEAET